MADWTWIGNPEGEFLRKRTRNETRPNGHMQCPVPSTRGLERGTIWQCRCGVRWKVNGVGGWDRRILPWPRPVPMPPEPRANLVSSTPTGGTPPPELRQLTRKELREIKKVEKSLRD